MSEGGGQQEPSMEEILASIRKIISEDDEGKQAAAPAKPEPEPAPPEEDELELDDELELVEEAEEEIELVDEAEEEVLELEEEAEDEVEFYDEPDEVEAVPPPPPAPVAQADALLGDPQRAQATNSLANLSTAIREHRPGLTVDQLAEDLLRPMLREWLDANLPDMVERLVQKEIQRMADEAEPK